MQGHNPVGVLHRAAANDDRRALAGVPLSHDSTRTQGDARRDHCPEAQDLEAGGSRGDRSDIDQISRGIHNGRSAD